MGKDIFDYPKPTSLVKRMIQMVCPDEDDIILDFFAGSCPTAHAVLKQNQEDGENRKFIMVQLPEGTKDGSEAKKAGYDTIADIGKERIRRVIKQIDEKEKKDNQLELGESGNEKEQKLDLGFKVFKLNPSNFKVWDSPDAETDAGKLEDQLDVFADHITPGAEQESILYEIILKSGYPLSVQITNEEIDGQTVYSIDNGELLIYLDDGLSFELLDAMAAMEPNRVVCLDKSFTGEQADALKTNAVQLFKKNDIAFRTV